MNKGELPRSLKLLAGSTQLKEKKQHNLITAFLTTISSQVTNGKTRSKTFSRWYSRQYFIVMWPTDDLQTASKQQRSLRIN